MKIKSGKSGWIFCSTGQLVVFFRMGDINDVTSGFERTAREEKTSVRELLLARYVIVFWKFSARCDIHLDILHKKVSGVTKFITVHERPFKY